jgi:hypothetical protein
MYYILLCLLIISDSTALINNIMEEALRVKRILDKPDKKSHAATIVDRERWRNDLGTGEGWTSQTIMHPRCLSSNGEQIAGIRDNRIYVHSRSTGNNSAITPVKGEIIDMHFYSNTHIIYTIRSVDRHIRLMLINLRTKEQNDLTPVQNAKSIHVTIANGMITTISHVGSSYYACRINPNNLTTQAVGTGSTDRLNEKIIFLDKARSWKIVVYENKVALVCTILGTGEQQSTFIQGRFRLSDVKALFGKNGNPLIISLHQGKEINHAPFEPSKEPHIRYLNQTFSNWDVISSTADGDIWLLRVCNIQGSNEYVLYDVRSRCIERNITSNFGNISASFGAPVRKLNVM